MKKIRDFGVLALGSRLSQISDRLYQSADKAYAQAGIQMQGRWFPVLYTLYQSEEPMGVTQIAQVIGQSHASVSQVIKALHKEGLVTGQPDKSDERRRLICLSKEGKTRCRETEPFWNSIQTAINKMFAEDHIELIEHLNAFERSLDHRSMEDRILEEFNSMKAEQVKIVSYAPKYKDDFKRLNLEWIEEYYKVEEMDEKVLSNPEDYYLKPGGEIYFALLGEEVVGVCAMAVEEGGYYSVSKMGVSKDYQGYGIGGKLLDRVIEAYAERKGKKLYLETDVKLKAAIHLYEVKGFVHMEPEKPSEYKRATVYMEYEPAA